MIGVNSKGQKVRFEKINKNRRTDYVLGIMVMDQVCHPGGRIDEVEKEVP